MTSLGAKHLRQYCASLEVLFFSAEIHLCPLWAVGGEIAVVIQVELPLVCACAHQELAYSALWVGLGPGFGDEASWSPCIADGVEDVVWGGVPSACAQT